MYESVYSSAVLPSMIRHQLFRFYRIKHIWLSSCISHFLIKFLSFVQRCSSQHQKASMIVWIASRQHASILTRLSHSISRFASAHTISFATLQKNQASSGFIRLTHNTISIRKDRKISYWATFEHCKKHCETGQYSLSKPEPFAFPFRLGIVNHPAIVKLLKWIDILIFSRAGR